MTTHADNRYSYPRRDRPAGVLRLEPDEIVEMIRRVLPAGAGSRLAIIAEVNPRLGARWASGEVIPPADVFQWIDSEDDVLRRAGNPAAELDAIVERLRAAGLQDITIGSHLLAAEARLRNR
ncbi:hypothetical protein [Chenggangzhangella methanolivorans]|uniref:Uncharacterized protein n=1 Tax=Chenggangzhangella methanolivorans TaxID=1437009 RepID=A0A9E6RCC7_9HYPH|nr:hypothetical protein [Chenggangzhangella methanolivorans]QZO00628.1 hypothetical protein K6K41_02625 [Chenggangzhangella methanolivorans]